MTLRPKHFKRDQSLHFTPLSETMSIPITFIWEFPPGWGAKDVLKINGQIVFWIIVNDTTECLYVGLDTDGNREDIGFLLILG